MIGLALMCIAFSNCTKEKEEAREPVVFFSDDFERATIGDNWDVMLDTSLLKLVNGELVVIGQNKDNPDKGVIFLKNDGYNKTAFTTSVDFMKSADSPGVSTYMRLCTDPTYTNSGFVANVEFEVYDTYMNITIGGNGTGGINIKPIAAKIWHTMTLTVSGSTVMVSVQTKAGEVLGTHTMKCTFTIKGYWGLSGASLNQGAKTGKPVYFDNFSIKQ